MVNGLASSILSQTLYSLIVFAASWTFRRTSEHIPLSSLEGGTAFAFVFFWSCLRRYTDSLEPRTEPSNKIAPRNLCLSQRQARTEPSNKIAPRNLCWSQAQVGAKFALPKLDLTDLSLRGSRTNPKLVRRSLWGACCVNWRSEDNPELPRRGLTDLFLREAFMDQTFKTCNKPSFHNNFRHQKSKTRDWRYFSIVVILATKDQSSLILSWEQGRSQNLFRRPTRHGRTSQGCPIQGMKVSVLEVASH